MKASPPCPAGVCQLELADGAFRGTPVGSGAYEGTAKLEVAKTFANGEGGVCASSFTNVARFVIKHGTGT